MKSSTYGAHTVHPLLLALNESCCRHPSEQAVQFRAHVLEILGTDYLIPQGLSAGPPGAGAGPPRGMTGGLSAPGAGSGPGMQGLHVALIFVNELIERTLDTEQVARDGEQLFARCLEVILTCDQMGSVKQEAKKCLELLMLALKQYPDAVQQAQMVLQLERFVTEGVRVYTARALRVLEDAARLNPQLFTLIIPTISAAVKASETKRGVGIDKQLRVAYFQVLQHLGERGRLEKAGLIREAEFL